jgi:hypothetical protein
MKFNKQNPLKQYLEMYFKKIDPKKTIYNDFAGRNAIYNIHNSIKNKLNLQENTQDISIADLKTIIKNPKDALHGIKQIINEELKQNKNNTRKKSKEIIKTNSDSPINSDIETQKTNNSIPQNVDYINKKSNKLTSKNIEQKIQPINANEEREKPKLSDIEFQNLIKKALGDAYLEDAQESEVVIPSSTPNNRIPTKENNKSK